MHGSKASKKGEVKLRTSTQNSHLKNTAASKNKKNHLNSGSKDLPQFSIAFNSLAKNEDLVIEIPTDRTQVADETSRDSRTPVFGGNRID